AVVPLTVGQSEQPLLENRIPPVPQRQAETETLLVVGNTSKAVFPPAVSPGAGMIMSEEVPGVARFAIVLADGAPLPFAQVWSPLLPLFASGAGFSQATVLVGR